MATMSEPRPTRGVATAAPAVETWMGVLDEADGWVVDGTAVVPETVELWTTAVDDKTTELDKGAPVLETGAVEAGGAGGRT
jgi:hypothetical protein